MRKILVSLLLIALLGSVVLPAVAEAVTIPELKDSCTLKHDLSLTLPDGTAVTLAKGKVVNQDTTDIGEIWGVICTIDTVFTVIDWVFWILIVLSIVLIFIGGILFVTATGDPTRIGNARKFLIFGVIGIVIAVLARAIPSIVIALLGF